MDSVPEYPRIGKISVFSDSKQERLARIRANVPAELRALPQWVVWRIESRDGKPAKVPYTTTGARAASNNPASWATFDQAAAAYLNGNYSGLMFAFAADDPYCGVDFDRCVHAGAIDSTRWAQIQALGSYAEISQSGTGIHVIGRGVLPEHGRKSTQHKIEMYDSGRFFVMTGDHIEATPATVRNFQTALLALHNELFPSRLAQPRPPAPSTQPLDIDDTELLERAMSANNGQAFTALWRGDLRGYNDDPSAADFALCVRLAWWTNRDAGRMDRLFRQSGLMRPKWDRRHYADGRTYGQATIEKAISECSGGYTGRRPDDDTPSDGGAGGGLTWGQVIDLARGWVRRANFAELVPEHLQAANGYRTNDTDKAIALGALAIFASTPVEYQYGLPRGAVSLLQLAEATGRSPQTCMRAMVRLAGWFVVEIDADKRDPDQARRYTLAPALLEALRDSCVDGKRESSEGSCETSYSMYATLPMDTHRAHDAFVRSMTPLSAEELSARIEARRADGKEAKATGDERRRLAALLPSAGPAALVVVDALAEFGPLRGVDLCELTHKSKYSISRAVSRLTFLGLVEVDDAGAVALVDGWQNHLNTITPDMPTAGTGRRRILARCDAIIEQCERITETVHEPPRWLHRRLERARKRKADIAAAEGFDGAATRRAMATGNHSPTWWDTRRVDGLMERHATARMDLAEESRRAGWELSRQMLSWHNDGHPKRDAARWAQLAGYSKREAWDAAHRVYGHGVEVAA